MATNTFDPPAHNIGRGFAMRKSFTIWTLMATTALALCLSTAASAKDSDDHGHSTIATRHAGEPGRAGHVPPGWSHGEKTGWGKADMPPGLRR